MPSLNLAQCGPTLTLNSLNDLISGLHLPLMARMVDALSDSIVISKRPVCEIVTLSGHSWLLEESGRQRRRHLLCLMKKNSFSKQDVILGKTRT
jgi:hypothetical protein